MGGSLTAGAGRWERDSGENNWDWIRKFGLQSQVLSPAAVCEAVLQSLPPTSLLGFNPPPGRVLEIWDFAPPFLLPHGSQYKYMEQSRQLCLLNTNRR